MIYDAYSKPVATAEAEPVGVTDMRSFGETLTEQNIKRGLQLLNRDINFDLGGRHNIDHPRITQWQGVFYNGHHVCTMDRGFIPEYDVWGLNHLGHKTHIMRVGWRSTFELMVRFGIPGVTWQSICRTFGIEFKKYNGHASELAAKAG